MKSKDIAKGMGVSPATMQAKYKIIWDGLELMQMHPHWSLPSRVYDNPLVWMLQVNGFIMDIRSAPREAQVAAYEEGLIPYIPADRIAQEGSDVEVNPTHQLFELEVSLLDGPITKAFLKKNPDVLVTDTQDETMVVRLACGGATPSDAWTLHCRIREKLVAWLQQYEDGKYLPRRRLMLDRHEVQDV